MTTEPAGGAQPGLDAALLQAIRPSAARMAADEETFVRLLHEDLGSPLRRLPDQGWGCCERIARVVLWLAASDAPAEAAVEAVHWLAGANVDDGFPLAEYVSVGHGLVRVARDMSGPKWTSAMGSAWIQFFMWLQPHLQSGAERAIAQQEAALRQAEAEREAARRDALDQATRQPPADVDVRAVAPLLDDEDEDDAPGYGQIMLGMTSRRPPPRHPSSG